MPWLLALLLVLSASAEPSPSFSREILPILQQHCQTCHRPGEIGKGSFLTYESTRPWAKAIKAAVVSKKMPPWLAGSGSAEFRNDRRLSERDIQTLAAWVDAGAEEGDAAKPKPVEWHEGWNIAPDLVLQMPDPYTVPATGALDYVYVVLPTGFTRDTWVAAAEVRPGARAVVHHVNAVVRPPGSQWMRDAKPFVPYIATFADEVDPQKTPVNLSYEFLTSYSPGMQPERFDIDRSAKLIPAGSDIVLQLHYTANGKAVPDQTRVGLELATEIPKKRFFSSVVNSSAWTIDPGDANAEGRARMTFGEPVELVFLQPHMHLRGKDMTVSLVYPDGKTETVLGVPRYDFNWQILYYLKTPRLLPQGTRVEVTAHWDNSANNLANPDPTATVRWGNQSWDEMLSVPMGVLVTLD